MSRYGSGRLRELVKRLIIATEQGSIKWEETDVATTFISVFSDGPTVQISSADGDGRHPYVLDVANSHGTIVDSLRSSNNSDLWDDDDMQELYELARRDATNVDDILDVIFNELPPIPQHPGGYSEEPPF